MTNLEKVEAILANRPEASDSLQIIKSIFGLIDLTTLEGTDNEKKIIELCTLARKSGEALEGLPDVAAVCVYPPFVRTAVEQLCETNIKVAAVAGGFPSGQMPMDLRLKEVEFVVNSGADEIDMVISRGRFLAGDYDFVFKEVSAFKRACGNAHLKVILETGELQLDEYIRKAAMIAMDAGADFIKTSTGKIVPAATETAVLLMLEEIREFYHKTGHKIGIKAAGGISDHETALNYYLLVKDILGEEWLNKDLFRIGASRLVNNILEFLEGK